MDWLALIDLAVLGGFAVALAHDALFPARSHHQPRWWKVKGVVAFFAYLAVATQAPALWDAVLAEHRLLDLTGLGTAGGAVVGLLLLELGIYAWHRTMHATPALWRWFHQMHHSAEPVDAFGAFWFHPLDMLGFTFVGSLVLVGVAGVTPEAAFVANAVATFLGYFQHMNVRTPRWLGYFVARPEMHALHHGRGVHACNFADLPLWDMLFGTWRNPATYDGPAGFYDGASERVVEMLLGRDVTTPPEERDAVPAK